VAGPKPDDDMDHEAIALTPNDRATIKSRLVQIMCTTPPEIQVHLSEAVSLIAASDFPDDWTNLLPERVQQFSTPIPPKKHGGPQDRQLYLQEIPSRRS
jgi:hypothetical protein